MDQQKNKFHVYLRDIGGTYFPVNIPAAEIQLSAEYGTRMRCSR